MVKHYKELSFILVLVAVVASLFGISEKETKPSEPTPYSSPVVPVSNGYLKFTFENLCGHGTCGHNVPWWSFKLDGRFEPPVLIASELQGETTIRSVSKQISRTEFEEIIDGAKELGIAEWIEVQDTLPHYDPFFYAETSLPLSPSPENMTIHEFMAKGQGFVSWFEENPSFCELKRELSPRIHRCKSLDSI